jgi:hypothetical protein
MHGQVRLPCQTSESQGRARVCAILTLHGGRQDLPADPRDEPDRIGIDRGHPMIMEARQNGAPLRESRVRRAQRL